MTYDIFTEAYIECAFWSSTTDDGTPMDAIDNDPAAETLDKMKADCADFQHNYAELLEQAYAHPDMSYTESQAGGDFWLTRNGHGAGFWDRGLGVIGDKLSDAARSQGSVDLYVGDDGLIYSA